MRIYIRSFVLVALCFAVLLKLTGCGSDSCGPQSCQCETSLASLWPNDDGRGWEYEYTWRTWSDTCEMYGNVDDVPPAPSLDTIEQLLASHPVGSDVATRVGTYKMRFDGDSTTMSGATAQALRDTAYFPDATVAAPGDMISTRAFLAASIMQAAPGSGAPQGAEPGILGDIVLTPRPILIHGGAWEKTNEYIGTYGDIDTDLAWKFLEDDLCAGSEFSFELSASGGGGRYAHCRVLGNTSVETEMGHFENGLDCIYMVDLGIMTYGGEYGAFGYRRHITYGNVIYVPDVGPVYSYERFLVCVGSKLSSGAGDMKLSLMNTGKD